MKKNIATRWVKALRSGKYVQGQGRLMTVGEDRNRYCCLGVLCEVVDVPYNYNEGGLPSPARDVAGMHSNIGSWDCEGGIRSKYANLAEMNDSGQSFKRIANFIERNYKEL